MEKDIKGGKGLSFAINLCGSLKKANG